MKKPSRPVHADLALLQREISQLLGRLAEIDGPGRAAVGEWLPTVDVYEGRGKIMIVVEVPGLSAESLRVVCRGGQVAVSGERRERRPTGAAGFLCLERPHGRFTRTLTLDVALDPSAAEARLQSGLLTIIIPRLKDRRWRETVIPVQREQEP